MRILIVEDHEDTRQVTARLLSRTYDVATAATFADAVRLFRSDRFDVAFVDIGLPDGDGWELGAVAKECGVKAVALTGYGMPEDIKKSYKAGFKAHVVKPISLDTLENAIGEITSVRPDFDRLPDNWHP